MKIGLNAKIYGMMAVVATFISVGGMIMTYDVFEVAKMIETAKSYAGFRTQLEEFKAINFETTLTAMDIIVDKDSGQVSDERKEALQQARAKLSRLRDSTIDNAGLYLKKSDEMRRAFEKTDVAFKEIENLIKTVERGSKDQRLYDELDDVIDGAASDASEIVIGLLEVQTKLSEKMDEDLIKISKLTIIVTAATVLITLISLLGFGIPLARLTVPPLRSSVVSLQTGVMTLNETTKTVKDSTHQLTKAVSDQSACITETVAAMTQIQSVIRRNLESFKEVNQLTVASKQRSAEGLSIMETMNVSMSELSRANDELNSVVKIIGQIAAKAEVINSIVFKTQMLSFNASIEAARAGAQGKGFAVVAAEVGRLADLSGKAASEISELLLNSQDRVKGLVENVMQRVTEVSSTNKDVSSRFEGIAQDIAAIATRVLETERGAMEQSTGVDQCVKAMNELDTVANKTQTITQSISEISAKIQASKDQVALAVQSTNAVVYGENRMTIDTRVVAPSLVNSGAVLTQTSDESVEDLASQVIDQAKKHLNKAA